MKTLHMKCVFVVTGFCLIIVSADVSLERTKPDPQQLPCPQQMIEFECEVLVPTATLIWALHTGERLEFGVLRSVGDVRSSSDNVYSATLTGKRVDDDPDTDRFFFTSTLLIREPVNETTLTCTGGGGEDPVDKSTTITLSGTPDPPNDLGYNDRVVIESSVDLQWTRPTYTGGVAVVNYTVNSTSGGTVTVKDSSEDVKYSPGLVYGDVQVSAINTCSQGSQPTVINIPAKVPPLPNISVQFTCESLPWTIELTYEIEEGVVYPNMDFILSLTPTDETASSHTLSSGDPACSDATSRSTYCTVNIPRDVYIISVNLTNDLGSTTNSYQSDTRAVIVTNEILEDGEPLSLTVTVNTACTVSCPVTVSFGTQPVSSGSCEFQQNVTSKMPLSPGDTTTLSVEAGSVTIQSGETYCYLVTLCGNPVHEGSGGGGGLPSAAVGGIVAGGAVTLLVTLAIITGLCLLWFYHKQTRCYKLCDNTTESKGVVAIECQGHCEDMPQMSKKNDQGKEKEVETGQQELTEEEKADLYSVPDKKRFQTAEGPVAIEHQEGPSGDCILYTVPQKPKKNKGKEKKENAGQEDLTEEEKAALHSVPDKKRQKFKTAGELNYADLVITSTSNPAPPLSEGSTYAVINKK